MCSGPRSAASAPIIELTECPTKVAPVTSSARQISSTSSA